MALSCEPWSWPEISKVAAEMGYPAERRRLELSRASDRSGSLDNSSAPSAPRLSLWRDTFGWCPFCQQIQMHLEEKGVAYDVRRTPLSMYRVGAKDPELLCDSPDGLVPALRVYQKQELADSNSEDSWKVVLGATGIAKFIESTCSGPQFLRCPGVDLNMSNVYLSLVDILVKYMHEMARASIAAASEPDVHSLRGPVREAEKWLTSTLEDIDLSIGESGGPFFFGNVFSVVDMAFAPWIDRTAAVLSFFSNIDIHDGRYPSLNAWSAAMASRPAHRSLRLDRETLLRVMSVGWIHVAPAAVAAVSSHALQSWPLPCNGASEDADKLAAAEAAQCLAACHEGVVELAGHRAPEGSPALIDKLLRAAAVAALNRGMPSETGVAEDAAVRNELAVAIIFVRSRIAVPRDMSEAAACRLRSLLQLVAEGLVGRERVLSLLEDNFSAYGEKIKFPTSESKANL